MRFSVLGSGSKGNVFYVETDQARLLIDAGLSCKQIERRLGVLGQKPGQIDAIIVTHEHIDHVRGVGVFARRHQVPVFINRATYARCGKSLGNIPMPVFFNTGDTLTFKDAELHFITKCHDAADPVALTIGCNGSKLGVVTDLGRPTPLIMDCIHECRGLILEFNHDLAMLSHGPYPINVKRRIRGPEGHLSNEQAALLLSEARCHNLSALVLAHLSEINNSKELALEEAERVIGDRERVTVIVSTQDAPLPVVSI